MATATASLRCDKCGNTYTYPTALAKHAMKCQGKPATSGRIHQPSRKRASAERTPPASKASRAVQPAKASSPFAGAIEELRAKRAAALTEADKYAGAISALEALA